MPFVFSPFVIYLFSLIPLYQKSLFDLMIMNIRY
nr:hypothetical protein YSBCXYJI_YSBCXYJI_CDS_0099 [Caudoviricetes sp.]